MNVELYSLIYLYVVYESDIYMIKSGLIKVDDDIDIINKKYIDNLKVSSVDLKQCHTFTTKSNKKMTVTMLYTDIISYDDLQDDSKLQKMDNEVYTKESFEYVKVCLKKYSTLKKIFKNEFTLPTVQKLVEEAYNIKCDRRNFRKKLVNSGCVKETNTYKSEFGRPAKVYILESLEDREVL